MNVIKKFIETNKERIEEYKVGFEKFGFEINEYLTIFPTKLEQFLNKDIELNR